MRRNMRRNMQHNRQCNISTEFPNCCVISYFKFGGHFLDAVGVPEFISELRIEIVFIEIRDISRVFQAKPFFRCWRRSGVAQS